MVPLLRRGRPLRRLRRRARAAPRRAVPPGLPLRRRDRLRRIRARAVADVDLVPPRLEYDGQGDGGRLDLRAADGGDLRMAVAAMKIGILGSGVVGQALGTGFATLGHDVKIGTRRPEDDKLKLWVRQTGAKGSVASPGEAARFAEVAVLATAWSGTENAIRLADPKNLAGKVVIDVTNPLKPTPTNPFALALGFDDSGGEQVQRWLPQARVVKAFNIVRNSLMVDPKLPGGPPDMFIAGDDAAPKQHVTRIS